jgi:hypothetical protein
MLDFGVRPIEGGLEKAVAFGGVAGCLGHRGHQGCQVLESTPNIVGSPPVSKILDLFA